jgi:release factor glutamine methyltransferase
MMSYVSADKCHKLQDIINESFSLLSGSGIDNPRLEAEMIISFYTGLDRLRLLLDREHKINEGKREDIIGSVRRRCNREPIQYLLGEVGFYGYQFKVKKGVFIPRPESEFLVEEGIKFASGSEGYKREDLNIVDLCTGSGAVGITLAKEIQYSRIYATDISPLGIEQTSCNARHLGVSDRIDLFIGDLFEPLKNRLPAGSVNLIVSNPPYIATADINSLPPEVRDHEPIAALDGGRDGLDLIRRIIEGSAEFLTNNGCLLLEVGQGQAGMIKDYIGKSPVFKSLEFRYDYAGIERIAILHG